jgi:hypothetical protein
MGDVFLLPHVHCCLRGDAFVLLDLVQDEYTLIMGAAAASLCELMGKADSAPPLRRRVESLQELIQAGLLTTDPKAGRIFTRDAWRCCDTAAAGFRDPAAARCKTLACLSLRCRLHDCGGSLRCFPGVDVRRQARTLGGALLDSAPGFHLNESVEEAADYTPIMVT